MPISTNAPTCRTSSKGIITPIVLAIGLLTCHAVVSAQSDLRLIEAVQQKNMVRAKELINADVNVNNIRADGATALLWAAHWNDLETVDLLLANGASVNVAEDQGVTPLTRACENSSPEMVSKLLQAGANPNKNQLNGLSPVIIAAGTGNLQVIKALIEAGADVNARIEITGQTALMWAASESHHDAMEALIAAGADINASSNLGFTPLLFVTRNDDIKGAKILISAGADVNQVGSDGTSTVALAVVSGNAEFARFLLAKGADPNGTIHGVSALHAAAGNVDMWIRDWLRARQISISLAARSTKGLPEYERLEMVKALLDAGANPNARADVSTTTFGWVSNRLGARDVQAIGTGNLRGATPLWVAAFRANRPPRRREDLPDDADLSDGGDSARIVRILLAAGADPTLTSRDGTTPLMVASGIGHSTFRQGMQQSPPSPSAEAVVRMLVESGADVTVTNEAGFTALHGAAFRGLNEVIAYLVGQGADINAQDYRERTAYRIAQGTQQSFYYQEWPGTADLLASLGADTTIGLGGRELERNLSRRLTDDEPES